jgi:hypothetical protein
VRTRAGLNIRRGAPTLTVPVVRMAAPNEVLEFIGWTSNRLSVNGNAHWYRTEDRNNFSAGATTRPVPGVDD